MAQDDFGGAARILHTHSGRVSNVPLLAASIGAIYVQSKDLDFDLPTREKFLDYILFDLEAIQDIPLFKVTIGTRNSLREELIWNDLGYVDFNNPIVMARLTSRFFTLRLEDEAPVGQWKLSRIEWYGVPVGRGRL